MKATLSCWLRLLWGIAPPLQLNSALPFIAEGAIHLPACTHWRHHAAAAAHAGAHLVYSPARFDGSGLGSIARTLLALLEDARVEALAVRELPGLARLWRPLHTATPALGAGFEALLERLARALADPDYDDPDPWVRKGHGLFYLDARLGLLALRTPTELREAATRLGHDIGQMRLQFNARTYRPAPAYRDDHRWMWAADGLTVSPPAAAVAADGWRDDAAPPPDGAETLAFHPEWDRLISRLRPEWCRVAEQPAPAPPAGCSAAPPDGAAVQAGRRLQAPLRAPMRRAAALRRSDHGDVFERDARVDWCIARRLRRPVEARVFRQRRRHDGCAAVWLLIDRSASTGSALGPGERSVLTAARQAASATVCALQAAGVAFAVLGFSSNGRHEVRLRTVKALAAPADDAMWARLQALRPGGSTRLGAALRHASRQLACCRRGPRWMLLLSDGEPHDGSVHDRQYRVEDARHAVLDAARRSVRTACLVLAPHADADARRIFGGAGAHALHDLQQLPRALQRLFV